MEEEQWFLFARARQSECDVRSKAENDQDKNIRDDFYFDVIKKRKYSFSHLNFLYLLTLFLHIFYFSFLKIQKFT